MYESGETDSNSNPTLEFPQTKLPGTSNCAKNFAATLFRKVASLGTNSMTRPKQFNEQIGGMLDYSWTRLGNHGQELK